MAERPTPTRAELLASRGAVIPDLIADDLAILLVGINPSLWSGWAGLHFARPGNRLWRTLHGAGLTDRVLDPSDTDELLAAGIGITNLVARSTARADELHSDELRAGRLGVERLVRNRRPKVVAFLGVSAFRIAYENPRATVGKQDGGIGRALVWVLPNPSGLNAHYQQPALNSAYSELRAFAGPRHDTLRS